MVVYQYGFKNEPSSNQLTIVTVEGRPETEEDEVPPIYEINVETIGGLYMILQLKNENGVDIK